MAAPRPTGFDEPVRPEDVAVEEALVDVDEDVLPEDPTIPDEANEADVLEQREEVPEDEDEDEELRDICGARCVAADVSRRTAA